MHDWFFFVLRHHFGGKSVACVVGPFHSKPLIRNLILFVSSMSTPFARHTSTFPIKYSIHNLFFLPPPGIAFVRKELRRWKASKRYESRTNSITFSEEGIHAKKTGFRQHKEALHCCFRFFVVLVWFDVCSLHVVCVEWGKFLMLQGAN